MNTGIAALCAVGKKTRRKIAGLMSGTSLDGLDIALCEFEGYGTETRVEVKQFITKSYTDNFKDRIQEVFSKRLVDLEQVTILNALIGRTHAALINEALKEWEIAASEVDLIASHGQTIYHAPASQHQLSGMPNATLQIGDGDHIAVGTGIITLSDFRQKHIAAGGEGAPLATYGDFLLFSDKIENRVLLNIGGIANFTFLPAGESNGKLISTDTGTGNTLMDAYVKRWFNKNYDEHAAIALSGKINPSLLAALLDHPFFDLPVPKTTGPELFNLEYLQQAQQKSQAESLAAADIMATLNRFSAETIARAVKQATQENCVLYTSGGGAHNPLLQKNLMELLPAMPIKSTADLGILPDAKEAVLFATLANECISPLKTPFSNSPNIPGIRMGKISLPD